MHDSLNNATCAQVARQVVDAARAHARNAGKPCKAPAGGAARRSMHTSGAGAAAEGAGAERTSPSSGASPAGDIALGAVLAADAVRTLPMPHGAARPEGSALRRNTHRAARPQEGRQLHGVPLTAATHQRKRPKAAAAVVKKVC